MSLLSIKNLTVRFKTASGLFTAVENVSLEVSRGEVVAIVGESGSGKSVSMLAVMGLLPWTAEITSESLIFDGDERIILLGQVNVWLEIFEQLFQCRHDGVGADFSVD